MPFYKGVITIKRRIVLSLLTLCLCCLFGVTVQAANPVIPKTDFDYLGTDVTASVQSTYRSGRAFFKDEADILPASMERDVWEKIQSTADYLNVNIAVFLGGNYRTDPETEQFTRDGTNTIFGSTSDTMFIYLDFEGYSPAYDYIWTSNNAQTIYPDTKRNKILNMMYKYLPKSSEPIYSDDIKQALLKGLDAVKSQGYVNNYQNNYNNNYTTQTSSRKKSSAEDMAAVKNFLQSIPRPVVIGIIIFVVLLVIVSAIRKAFRRRSSTSYYNTSYPPNNYPPHSNYHSSYHHSRPSYRSSLSRSSHSHHSSSSHSSSHRSSSSGGSGSGHHR